LMIHVLVAREPSVSARRYDVRGALAVAAAALGTVAVINLPFALAGYEGWRASFIFQQLRQADITTNSIWYWGLRPLFGNDSGGNKVGTMGYGSGGSKEGYSAVSEASFQYVVSVASPMLVLLSFVLALWLGWKRYTATGVFPWVGVSGAMLCGFLLFHKVHSPQYTLWLIPFLVLLEVPWTAVVGYLLADAAIGIGVFRYFYTLGSGESADLQESIVEFGVWGRALLLVVFFFIFARADLRGRRVEPPRVPRFAPGELIPVTH
jgi:uncharacterized membrane protein